MPAPGMAVSQTNCAFANEIPHHQRPGYLLTGVNDKGMLL